MKKRIKNSKGQDILIELRGYFLSKDNEFQLKKLSSFIEKKRVPEIAIFKGAPLGYNRHKFNFLSIGKEYQVVKVFISTYHDGGGKFIIIDDNGKKRGYTLGDRYDLWDLIYIKN